MKNKQPAYKFRKFILWLFDKFFKKESQEILAKKVLTQCCPLVKAKTEGPTRYSPPPVIPKYPPNVARPHAVLRQLHDFLSYFVGQWTTVPETSAELVYSDTSFVYKWWSVIS